MTNLPVTGIFNITATYGQIGKYWIAGHKGIDFVTNNRDIYATCEGTVRVIAYDKNGWGNYISIGDNDGNRHIFCHIKDGSVKVYVGQKVDRTTKLGIMGDTGNANGVHLHYQLNDISNVPINPCNYLGIPNAKGTYNSENYQLKEEEDMIFNDSDQIADWAKGAVDRVSDAGLMLGDDKGNFNPKDSLTREEAAVILDRAIDKLK